MICRPVEGAGGDKGLPPQSAPVHDPRVPTAAPGPVASRTRRPRGLDRPASVVSLHQRLPRRVPRARQIAADALTSTGAPPDAGDLALAITELVGNAVRHGRGLTLVAACSRDWGFVASGRGRTRVWAEVQR
jgi:hypothetical protein